MKQAILLPLIIFAGCEGFSVKVDEGALSAPTLSLSYPASVPHSARNPTIRVSGVKSGETIKLYSDSNCSSEIASQTASGSSVDISLTTVAFGSHNFYAKRISSSGASSCSPTSASYNRECPDADWVPVEPTDGVSNDFCVMKFEARDDGTGKPISTPVGHPWRSIAQQDAIVECASLGAGYGLMTNEEWMIMALDVEANPLNWSTGTQGLGHLPSGNSEPASVILDVADQSDPWNGTGFDSTTGWHQRRTFHLSNGSMVWDLAGNAFEWLDLTIAYADKAYSSSDPGPVVSVRSLDLIDTNIASGPMEQSKWLPAGHPYPLNARMGGYFADNNSEPNDIAVARGGSNGMGNGSEYSGVFTMAIVRRVDEPRVNVGFRCVFRP